LKTNDTVEESSDAVTPLLRWSQQEISRQVDS